mgnify:CR=1 FL=1
MLKQLQAELAQRAKSGLMRQRRVLSGAQQPEIDLDGQALLAFASNDYLGLAQIGRASCRERVSSPV